MNLSMLRLFSFLSLCLLALGVSARGDEVAATPPAPELYQLKISLGEVMAPNVAPKISTQIAIEEPFNIKIEESVPAPKLATADTKPLSPTVTVYSATGVLHAPRDGKFKLDCKTSAKGVPSGTVQEYDLNLELELDKGIGHVMMGGLRRGVSVLLTKAKAPAKPEEVSITSTDGTIIKGRNWSEANTIWGREINGLQLGMSPPPILEDIGIFPALKYAFKRYRIGEIASCSLVLRNNSDKPLTVTYSPQLFVVPMVVDSAGKSYAATLPNLSSTKIMLGDITQTLEAGKSHNLRNTSLRWGPQGADLLPSVDVEAGNYLLSYRYRVQLVADNGTKTTIELTSGQREFILSQPIVPE